MTKIHINRFLFTVVMVALASALRIWPLAFLGSTLVWLTFYPTVLIVAVYGGFFAGLLATGLACVSVYYFWPLLVATPFINNSGDWLDMSVFVATCLMLSVVAEVMLRAKKDAKTTAVLLKDSETRLQVTERELQLAKQTAENASHIKGEFLANISHEIRTPMNVIIGLARLVADTELNLKQRDYLDKIQASSQTLLEIVNDILDLAKIESGQLVLECIEFDPTHMLQSVSDMFVVRAEEKGLEIFLDIAPEIPMTVVADPLRIRQILINLFNNAIKFTSKGEICVHMEVKDGSADDLLLHIDVRDTGIGINKAVIEHLFQSFDESKARKFYGTGLGLTISKQLVELMGGQITVSSQTGRGSTFSFTIRCGRGRSYNWQQDTQHLKDARVLVVDDHETSCIILRNILESWRLRVSTALSAKEALAQIQTMDSLGTPFGLLLVDWQMEDMSGLELAEALGREERQGKLNNPPTIIMVTAYSKDQLLKEARGVSAHLDAILTKPVVPSVLLNTIFHVYHYQGVDDGSPEIQIDPYEAARPLRNARVLLVEDDKFNQQVAAEFLEKVGLHISIANHGGEAVQWLKREKFDAVLMDLQMPDMDGYEATQRIRELPNGNLPIIALTASAMQHDREACIHAGMNDHVVKPIDSKELIDTLLRWIKPVDHQHIESSLPKSNGWASLAEKLPGFDLTGIMAMLSGDQYQFMRMLGVFRQQFTDEAPAIAALITQGDIITAKKRLHTFKGAVGNFGARDLLQLCNELETQLMDGQYNASTLALWLNEFERTMATLATLEAEQSVVVFSESVGAMLE